MPADFYAVVDTNVLVSALFTRNPESNTKRILDLVLDGAICPLVNDEIIAEYQDVLSRDKFPFKPENVHNVIAAIEYFGYNPGRTDSDESFPDPKDVVFYEVALSKEGSYLITGNTKHFPRKQIVVSPAEFMEIFKSRKDAWSTPR